MFCHLWSKDTRILIGRNEKCRILESFSSKDHYPRYIHIYIYIYTHKQIVRLSCFLLEISKEGRKYRKEYSVEILQRLFPTFLEDPM